MKLVDNWIKNSAYQKLRTINEVDEKRIKILEVPKDKIDICVIDDEGFDINPLNALGFRSIIKHMQFSSISEYEKFNVILCDVDGIGGFIDPQQQGIAIADLLKKSYPNKLIYLYSGKPLLGYGTLPEGVTLIRKPISANDLGKVIASDYKESIKPMNIWKSTKQQLTGDGVSTKTLAYLEDVFVNSILEGEDFFSSSTINFQKKHSLDVRPELLSLLSAGVKLILLLKDIQ